MRQIWIILVLGGCFVSACMTAQSDRYNDVEYRNQKNEFANAYVTHFPDSLTKREYIFVSNKNTDKNNVCFLLYQYNPDKEALIHEKEKLDQSAIAVYQGTDTCLLRINQFETLETLRKRIEVVDIDTNLLIKQSKCKKLPIPTFINFKKTDYRDAALKSDKDFKIYVLEAKSGVYDEKLQEKPDIQMPVEWENGFSRGVAINMKDKAIIYWFVMW